MSWPEIFPIFDDDMLERYQKEASEREKRAMADLFAVDSIHNEKKVGHVVATSLFWKPACLGEADFPTPSKAVMENPGVMWRFLAMEEEGLVTMSDSDRAGEMIHDIERTELVAEGGLCVWRRPYRWGTTECTDLGQPQIRDHVLGRSQ